MVVSSDSHSVDALVEMKAEMKVVHSVHSMVDSTAHHSESLKVVSSVVWKAQPWAVLMVLSSVD